ncbi:TPA: GGDEF domain-containing protein, partial [Vibrio parahaemolyticus]|nr:GGDEF domain-containing protein [Vibrio parahaemolyticus]
RLNKFKPVNDEYGHHAGDVLLKDVAKRLLDVTRSDDMVFRVGGDEFWVVFRLVSAAHYQDDLISMAKKIHQRISEPYFVDDVDGPLAMGAAIGMGAFPYDSDDIKLLIRLTDKTMYLAKSMALPFLMVTEGS